MVWPPQNTGYFAVPECISCCAPQCIDSFFNNPHLESQYTQTARSEFPGTTCADSNQTTFTRYTCNVVAGEFGFDRYWIDNAYSFDPSDPACFAIGSMVYSMSCRIQSRTGSLDPTVHFDPMIKQGGNFFICNTASRRWSLTAVQASFQAKGTTPLSSDGWERFNVSDPAPTVAAVPDFTTSGGIITFGFRASYGSLNFEGVDREIVWDVENFGVAIAA